MLVYPYFKQSSYGVDIGDMSGMKFKRVCDSCNAVFFATDRKASHCPKCTKKKQEAHSTTLAPKPEKRSRSLRFSAQKKAKRAQRPAKSAELTPELREKILKAYAAHKEQAQSLRVLHAIISQEAWVKPCVVAQALKEVQPAPEKKGVCTLSDEQKSQVIGLYLKMIAENIRPAEGRRQHIARLLQLPKKEVVLAVREWSEATIGALTREQLFEIEKAYWHLVTSENHTYAELPSLICRKVGFASEEQVLRWLDQLHDSTKLTRVDPKADPETIEKIRAEYRNYLQQPKPPEHALHYTLAKAFEMTPTKIHKILCDYRLEHKPL